MNPEDGIVNSEDDTERLQGVIERITYRVEDTGYTVARFRQKGKGGGIVTIVGNLASVNPGESLILDGEWSKHAQYGRQFKVVSSRTVYPTTLEGIRKYLGSGLIKGVGPVTAGRIVDYFGEETLEIIEKTPSRLTKVEGLGRKRVEMIQRAWEAQREIKEVMLFLQSHEVSTGHATKIWKHYGNSAISLVRENPYRLADDIWGFGFLTADRIAQKLGVEARSEKRIRAGIRYVLGMAADNDGHVFLPLAELTRRCSEDLGVDADLVSPCLETLEAEDGVIVEKDRIYIPPLRHAEQGVATRVHQLTSIARIETGDLNSEIAAVERKTSISFAAGQKDALKKALSHGLLVITGGPGTGKTTTIIGMLSLFERRNKRTALAAPTGRAARRMTEATGREARTIHRLLKFNPQRMSFEHDAHHPLKVDTLIVDEVSMIDVVLLNSLLRAVPLTATVVLVGDVDQLPSVGPGNCLRDLIGSKSVPVVVLNEIFRQAQQSRIVTNAHRINIGELPEMQPQKDTDFFFIEEEDPARIAETIKGLCTVRLPRTYGLDPIQDIQVLSPMYRGETGATQLNALLQGSLNPFGPSVQRGDTAFRVGDKVMQVRNDYTQDVFNGDLGVVSKIDLEEGSLEAAFPHRIEYDVSDLDKLVLAYAISCHKSQGSEYKAVVMPITTQHYTMLQRNLLYTAVTRARMLVVLVGTRKALAIAVKNNSVDARYTSLVEKIRERNPE